MKYYYLILRGVLSATIFSLLGTAGGIGESILQQSLYEHQNINVYGVSESPIYSCPYETYLYAPIDVKKYQKTIYLTFDDGPLGGTGNVLNVLQEEGVEATLFFVGKHINYNKNVYDRAVSMPNMLVSNHTFSHANGKYRRFYGDGEKLLGDIEKAQNMIGGAKYLRLAGRNVWRLPTIKRNDGGVGRRQSRLERPKYDLLASQGYHIFGWDLEWGYNHKTGKPLQSAESVAEKIETHYQSGNTAKHGKVVLLTHDFMFRDKFGGAESLKTLIQILKASNWTFKTLDSYSGKIVASVFAH